MQYNFEWDPNKAIINESKHKISFEQATTVFKDSQAISIYDDDHSFNEDRWITIGLDSNGFILVIHHTFNQIDIDTTFIRMISSRKATKNEQKQYYKE